MLSPLIRIRGARQHNLKSLSVDIPKNSLVAITGVSGSGKSSLAFDTIYAEGQRRYVESLSAYARQFLEQMDKPDVDLIDGLSPAIAIQQRATAGTPRSTVGTATEIYDHLRILFASIGVPHCPECHLPISAQSVQEMVDCVLELPLGSRAVLLAPVVKSQGESDAGILRKLARDGFTRVSVNGEARTLDDEIHLDENISSSIKVVVDRLVVKEDIKNRLTDSIELALSISGGLIEVDIDSRPPLVFSRQAVCPGCGQGVEEISPRIFSFNSPHGACPDCGGLGTRLNPDPGLIVPDPAMSIRDGALAPWAGRSNGYMREMVEAVCRHSGIDPRTPFSEIPEEIKRIFLHGSGTEPVRFEFVNGNRRYSYDRPFEGVIPNMVRRYREASSPRARQEMEAYMSELPCLSCRGARLKRESRAVKIGGKALHEITSLTVDEAAGFLSGLILSDRERAVSDRLLKEILSRLGFISSVGLGYLSLDRGVSSLSNGEDQRIRLATQIGSGLSGVLYVLDEPSIGLHPRDNLRLLENLIKLRDLGNTVLVVEHDEETILASDHVVDIGPGAGENGGRLVFSGPPEDIVRCSRSLTGRYLSGNDSIPVPGRRRRGTGETLFVKGARRHNLQDISVSVPLGTLTCVTGVSGSGKSSLVNDIIYPFLSRRLHRSKSPVGLVREIEITGHMEKVIRIDQAAIGRTPRSNPATYTGIFNHIRDLFALLPESRRRGYKPGRFSFNVKGGRCEACTGDGIVKIEMHFLPDVYVTCDSCNGRRYNRDTLEVRLKGFSIADVLDMTVNRALGFFESIPAVHGKLETLADVGLGYLKLGQQATTLSGGEAQRVKLARELGRRAHGSTLYLLDEPTTGLHPADIRKLLRVLDRLVEKGNTVVVIEHQLDVIKTADYIIDLGPEGGVDGGKVVASGTPEEISATPGSHTGVFLRKILEKQYGRPL